MKPNDILNAIGGIRDSIIEDAHKIKKASRKKWLIPTVAAMLVITVTAGVFLFPWHNTDITDTPSGDEIISDLPLGKYLIAKAEYPKMTQNPHTDMTLTGGDYTAWREDVNRQLDYHYDGLNIDKFIKNSTAELLSEKDTNKIYSPLNIYIALSMLAEITDGNTRKQITDVLGVDSIEKLRDNVTRLWNSTYIDDGLLTTLLANSVWLSEDFDYNKDTLIRLAKEYFASSYAGKMGDEEYTKELKNWINEQTKGFLSNQVENIKLGPETIISLVSTIYFKGVWQNEFDKEDTKEDTFYTKDGEKITDFMNKTEYLSYYDSDGFSAVKKGFKGNSNMYLILPDKETDINALIADSVLHDFIISPEDDLKEQEAYVKLSVPKFDVNSSFSLSKAFSELGITDAFNPTTADFTPIYEGESNIFVTDALHSTRVMIDEEGCEAAAFTMTAEGTGIFDEPPEPIEFTLDRPFIFVITSQTGIPLFIGTVNNP